MSNFSKWKSKSEGENKDLNIIIDMVKSYGQSKSLVKLWQVKVSIV